MSISWPNHLLTIEEWDALPEDNSVRRELAEGLLVMSPKPVSRHQKAGERISYRVGEQLPHHLNTVQEVDVLITAEPPTIRNPDVVVTRTAVYEAGLQRYQPGDILLAVEVLSDGTRRVDRILKFAEYAEAGIPQYWIVDVDEPITLLSYVLVGNGYELSGEHTGPTTLDVAGHPVMLDLAALTRR